MNEVVPTNRDSL
jgi:hypothetical protein